MPILAMFLQGPLSSPTRQGERFRFVNKDTVTSKYRCCETIVIFKLIRKFHILECLSFKSILGENLLLKGSMVCLHLLSC